MERFLKLKHWQLFGLMFFVPLVVQIGFVLTIVRNFMALNASGVPYNQTEFLRYFSYYPVLIIYLLIFHIGWYWSVGVKLQSKIPDELKLKTGMYKTFLLIPVAYALVMSTAVAIFFTQILQFQTAPNPLLFWVPFVLLPFNLFIIFCSFYCMYFTARTIKTVELQRAARLDDYIGEFFLIWFFPIGVWILQPRLNRLVAEDENSIYKPGSDYMMK
jgi:hypothetical protein